FYLACLREVARDHGCRIHAYVLLPNHVHLLGTPRTRNGFTGMMQTMRDRYAQHVKKTYPRVIAPLAGLHQASGVQPDRTVLEVYRYIELHPVRSGLAPHPANYRWSSHARHALGVNDELITEHEQYRALSVSPTERFQAYRELLRQPLDPRVVDAIRQATAMEGVLGDESFVRQIEMAVKRRMVLPLRVAQPAPSVGADEQPVRKVAK
ncbi:MAG: transposase, partial [Pirellulales bacterium]